MRVAIEAASLALTSGGLARYTSELSLALARCFPDDEYLPGHRPAFPHARGRATQSAPAAADRATRSSAAGGSGAWRARWARLHADLVHGPDFAVPYLSRRPSVLTLHDLSPWMDARWHPCRRPGPPAHAGAAGPGHRDHGDHAQRECAQGGDRALPPAAGPRRGGAGGGRVVAASGGGGAGRLAVLPVRRHAGAAQESGDAGGGLAGGARDPSASIW